MDTESGTCTEVVPFEQVFLYARLVTYHPTEPPWRHVWVRNHGDHGSPTAGVVVAWQPAPVPTSATEQWVALVARAPFGDALLLDWVGASRLVPLRDPRPAGVDA